MFTKFAIFYWTADNKIIPVGIVLWSSANKHYSFRLFNGEFILPEFDKKDLKFLSHAEKQINRWIDENKLPYPDDQKKEPWEDEWWIHVRSLFVHELKLSESIVIAPVATKETLDKLYNLIIIS